MSYIKASEDIITDCNSKASNLASTVDTINGQIDRFVTEAAEYIREKKTKFITDQTTAYYNAYRAHRIANRTPEYDETVTPKKFTGYKYPTGYEKNLTSSAFRDSATTKANELFDPILESVNTMAGDAKSMNTTDVGTKLQTVSEALAGISSKISNFNNGTATDGTTEFLKITFSRTDGVWIKDGTGVANPNFGDGKVERVLFEIDGNTYTISELLNAFYTYTGSSIDATVGGYILAKSLGIDYTEAMQKDIIDSVGALTSFAGSKGLFGVATDHDIKKVAADLDIDLDKSDVTSILGIDGSKMSEEDRKKYGEMLLDMLNGKSIIAGGATVAGSALGAFGLASYLAQHGDEKGIKDKDPDYKAVEESSVTSEDKSEVTDLNTDGDGNNNTSTSGGGGGGGGGHNTESPTEQPSEDPTTTPTTETPTTTTEPTSEEPIIGTEQPLEGSSPELTETADASELPSEPVTAEIEKDYDDLARQQYEQQGEEQIAEHRAQITEEANRLFDAEDKTELINKLKEYGYSETDIAQIIQDRELTITAMISGDERAELAKIAAELAKADGLETFDTVYDNEQTLSSLTDGTATELLAIVTQDKDVATAYESLATASTTYTEAAASVNTAVAAVEAARQELLAVQESIGTEIRTAPSQWDATSLKNYNDEVTALFEEQRKTIGGNIANWSSEDLTTYQNAQTVIQNEVAYNRGANKIITDVSVKSAYEKTIEPIKSSYMATAKKKGYGTDATKWPQEFKDQYNAEIKEKIIEVGNKYLTDEDRTSISNQVQTTKDNIIKKNGAYSKWTETQKSEYQTKLDALKEKYGEGIVTDAKTSHWTDDQAKKYNDAVAKYNKAVEDAKAAMTAKDEAKTAYDAAKESLAKAKEDYYTRIKDEKQAAYVDPATVAGTDIVDPQTSTGGQLSISGVEIGENGGVVLTDNTRLTSDGTTSGGSGLTTSGGLNIELPDNVDAGTGGTGISVVDTPVVNDEIVNEDADLYQDYGVPVVDASSAK